MGPVENAVGSFWFGWKIWRFQAEYKRNFYVFAKERLTLNTVCLFFTEEDYSIEIGKWCGVRRRLDNAWTVSVFYCFTMAVQWNWQLLMLLSSRVHYWHLLQCFALVEVKTCYCVITLTIKKKTVTLFGYVAACVQYFCRLWHSVMWEGCTNESFS